MNFTRVTRTNRCPICKKADWCRVFADGWAECMRVQSDKPAKSGGWMHSHRQGLSPLRLTPPKFSTTTLNATKLMRDWLAATPPAALDELAASLGVSTPSLVAVGAA